MPLDPGSLATSAATITQLVGLFRQEVGARKDLTHRQFIEWLDNHRHEEIKELITHTFHLQTQVDDLLRQDHVDIMSKLDAVNQIVVTILSRIDGLSAVAAAVVPDLGLSDDAISYLRLLAKSKDPTLFNPGGEEQVLIDHRLYELDDTRFFHDDLNSLVNCGFLAPSYSPTGELFYRLTRRGAKFVDLLPAEQVDVKQES